jgi:hypothetical protein
MFSNRLENYLESNDFDETTKCTENDDIDEGTIGKNTIPHFEAFKTHIPNTLSTQSSPPLSHASSYERSKKNQTTRNLGCPPKKIGEMSPKYPLYSK